MQVFCISKEKSLSLHVFNKETHLHQKVMVRRMCLGFASNEGSVLLFCRTILYEDSIYHNIV